VTPQQHKSRHVVLLDCEGSKKGLAPDAFSSLGIDLLTASTPRGAIEKLSKATAGVFGVDIRALGVPQIAAVRKNLPDLAIIVMLGFNDGDLIHDSQLGKAATTILTQPITRDDVLVAVQDSFKRKMMSGAEDSLSMEGQARKPSVILAEDDSALRRLMEAQLKKCGYEVTSAEDGDAALEVLASNDFDILVTDINMPGVDGIQLTTITKTQKPKMPVIVCSGSEDVKSSMKALIAGAYCYVVKPVNITELSFFMDRAMRTDKLERGLREQNKLLESRTTELANSLAELRRQSALQDKSRLAAIQKLTSQVAHELKNPLNSISASFSYVRNQIPQDALTAKPKIAKHCDIVDAQIERSKGIIEGMLDYARPGEARDIEDLGINEIVQEAARLALPAAEQLDVRFELSPDAPVVAASKLKLQQVFANLMINATKAMKNKGTLTIRTETDGELGVKISLCDTGPGVPAGIIDRIFDPFFTTAETQGGTGLGLAICRETVERCGGTITVGNCPQGGAVFAISLPLKKVAEKVAQTAVC